MRRLASNAVLRSSRTPLNPLKSHDVAIAGLQLVHAFRDHGYRIANLDPLGITRPEADQRDLELASYGLTEEQLREPARLDVADTSASGFARNTGELTLQQLHARLSQIYSGSMGIETVHCKPEHMRWLENQLETITPIVPPAWRKRQNIAQLTQAHMFEATLASRYANVKRFGIEGAESVIVGLNALLDLGCTLGVSDVVMGMPHRGRLNVLANVAKKPMEAILCEFRGGASGTLADEQRLREQSDAVFASLVARSGQGELSTHHLHGALLKLGIDANMDEAQAVMDLHDRDGTSMLGPDEFFSLVLRLLGTSFSGDVKYHLGFTQQRTLASGKTLTVSMLPNPSHLEAVNPLVVGLARARQLRLEDGERKRVLPLLLHGDAAFCGQGVVFECLGLSDLFDYTTGGAIHVVINNQIGFTTTPRQSRSSNHCTDVAKTVGAPIFHVNGDDVEAVVRACTLAIKFRQTFQKDVVVDVVCYRRHGHQETDNPMFTQPEMYTAIKAHPPVIDRYTEQLVSEGIVSAQEAATLRTDAAAMLADKQELAKTYVPTAGEWLIHGSVPEPPSSFRWVDGKWQTSDGSEWPLTTGVDEATLQELTRSITTLPPELSPHRVVNALYKQRSKMIEHDAIDWALAEQLAWASCLVSGVHVRLSGQDVERGTFSHRHAVLHDQVKFGERFVPLQNLSSTQAPFEICNSSLSEFAVLGFELGCSLETQPSLIMWEAQFGDFANTAQCIIDQFICAAESKWSLPSALVMLLPHGLEGAGPEHSSARLERFLQLCDDDEREVVGWDAQIRGSNWQVVNVTTPANFFHVLRRQVVRPFRKPLVVMAPKQLLRHKLIVSPLEDFLPGSRFRRVIVDEPPGDEPERVKRLLLCSGRLWLDLLTARDELGERASEVALLRLEQIAPFPYDQLESVLETYPNAELVWVQEEPLNSGAWSYVRPRIELVAGGDDDAGAGGVRRGVRYIGRRPSAAPATGLGELHKLELEELLREAMDLSS